jgi:hypothetical protein
MKKDKKGLSGKEKRRLKFIRRMREQRDIAKRKSDIDYPRNPKSNSRI